MLPSMMFMLVSTAVGTGDHGGKPQPSMSARDPNCRSAECVLERAGDESQLRVTGGLTILGHGASAWRVKPASNAG
jgi:hypothetical protein